MSIVRDGRVMKGAHRLPKLKGHDLYADRYHVPDAFHVYAYLDASRRVLYVGQSHSLRTRNGSHHLHSEWYPLAAEFRVLWTAKTREEARACETKAIRELAPLFNVAHNRRAA